jgi:hypothetical protein
VVHVHSTKPSDLWFSGSFDGGSTFSTPAAVTNNQSAPTAVQMITDSERNILLVWSGIDASGHDVFFTKGTPGDFTISAAPGIQSVLPGGAAKFALTLTASGGFSNDVSLTCTNLPPGSQCF